jgi:hypothetical protein
MNSPVRPSHGPINLNKLKFVLNNTGKPWAFTGSQAMKIHANAVGKTSRLPHDFDILVNSSNIKYFIHALTSLGYKRKSYSPLQTVRKVTMIKNGNKSVDLLFTGHYGPRMNTSTVKNVIGFPVVTIPQLILYKNKNSPNINFLMSL